MFLFLLQYYQKSSKNGYVKGELNFYILEIEQSDQQTTEYGSKFSSHHNAENHEINNLSSKVLESVQNGKSQLDPEEIANDAYSYMRKMMASLSHNETAFHSLLNNANSENPVAQYYMCQYYSEEFGIIKDPEAHYSWLHRAAEWGHPTAQVELALLYQKLALLYQKNAVELSNESLHWIRKSAENGCLVAQMALGNQILVEATITIKFPIQPEESARWLYAAATQGSNDAQFCLALTYLGATNRHFKADMNEAIKWLTVLATNGTGAYKLMAQQYLDELASAEKAREEFFADVEGAQIVDVEDGKPVIIKL